MLPGQARQSPTRKRRAGYERQRAFDQRSSGAGNLGGRVAVSVGPKGGACQA
jgi:hypothetical protein